MKKQEKMTPQGVFMVSLGCSKNLVDTEVIAGTLLVAGRTLAFDPDDADLYVINTCAFLPSAREEAFAAIRDAVLWKKEYPSRKIVVAGCLTEWDKAGDARKEFPEVDLWTGVNDVAKIAALLDGEKQTASAEPTYLYDHATPRLQLTLPHLAYLKIADGCNNRCTYCAIPNIRGVMRSRPIASVVQEAKNLIEGGVKELLVIAQDITVYGLDRPESKETLPLLLKALSSLEGDFIIRLLYTHPAHYTDEFIDYLSQPGTRIVPYLDIPLQHISDRILKAMHRNVTKAETLDLLNKLRERIPDLTIRTTFITGFPGETEEEFAELQAFMKEFKFERCGVFAYSAEPGTPAAKLPDQVPTEIAEARAKKLMRQQKTIMKNANRKWVGREVTVLIDDVDAGTAVGRAMMDAPEIDNVIILPKAKRLKPGQFCRVRIIEADSYEYTGELCR